MQLVTIADTMIAILWYVHIDFITDFEVNLFRTAAAIFTARFSLAGLTFLRCAECKMKGYELSEVVMRR